MTTLAELADISAAIHDEWFHVERLEHDVEQATVLLPIYAGRWRKRWVGWTGRPPKDSPRPPIGTLVVRNVTKESVAELPPRSVLAVAGAAHDVGVPLRVHKEQLLVAGGAGGRLHHPARTVHQAVGVDQVTGEHDPREAQRVLRAEVVAGGIVAVPHQLDAGAP